MDMKCLNRYFRYGSKIAEQSFEKSSVKWWQLRLYKHSQMDSSEMLPGHISLRFRKDSKGYTARQVYTAPRQLEATVTIR